MEVPSCRAPLLFSFCATVDESTQQPSLIKMDVNQIAIILFYLLILTAKLVESMAVLRPDASNYEGGDFYFT